ncbi:MAG TPA: putative metallopeptidase [Thermomicrobiales bacterium]|nr:putative metallopeptidase [Thermomicrobiales bacterium]
MVEEYRPAPITRLYVPPSALTFGDAEFRPAPDLARGAAKLLEAYPEDLAVLNIVQPVYLWRKKGGMSAGKDVLGKTTKLSGMARYLSGYVDNEPVDIVIWLAADHLAIRSDRGIEAVLFHELLHVGLKETDDEDDVPAPIVLPHDWAGFRREIEVYGLHTEDARQVAPAFAQVALPIGVQR